MMKHKLHEKLPWIGRILSLIVLMSVIGALVVSFIKRSSLVRPPPPVLRASGPARNVVAVTEGYEFVNREARLRLIAEKDITYDDGRHELEKLNLMTYSADGKEESKIRAERGTYQQQTGIVTFSGNVIASNADGLEVRSESLTWNQNTGVGNTDVAVSFKYRELSGSSVGAVVQSKTKNLALLKDAHLIITSSGKLPTEIRGQKADFAQNDGVARLEGDASIVQGNQSGRADTITGIFTRESQPKLIRVEMRGNAWLKSQEQGKSSELQARDMDFHFDENQQLKAAGAWGGARAKSLEKDAPREVTAELIEAQYTPTEKGSELKTITTQGRTVMKITPPEGSTDAKAAERVLEADAVQMSFQPGGKYLAHAEANGNALLTVTPVVISPAAERKRLRAPKFTAEFFETNNLLRNFIAESGTTAEFEPMQEQPPKGKKREKRTLTGKKMTADFDAQTQDVSTVRVEGDAKFVEGERQATAASALYTASNSGVALRGKPQVWDSSLRVSGDEIDASIETGESFARGRVRTTYYSRETTNGAAPFKKQKAPVFIASDRAQVKHREGAARYEGNARAWQDDNFVRASVIELDKNEKTMTATGNVNSALYTVEREIETNSSGASAQAATLQPATEKTPKRKEVVPIFASSEQMSYSDSTRLVQYTGNVRIRQGSDQIEAAKAEVKIDEENRLERLTATTNVVLTQPSRRGTGDQVEYTAATDTAILTGSSARIEDREREAVTTGSKLTLHLRDARIQAADEGGSRRVKTTHRIRQQER